MSRPLRPSIQALIAEHKAELDKPAGSRTQTRLDRFITALQKVQSTPSSEGNLSYFYLASYHGLSSDNVYRTQRRDVPPEFSNSRFCPHGLPEFPAWHRVYLWMFEKALQSHDSAVMLPFWNEIETPDPQTGYPSLFDKPTFQMSDGSTVRNPLFSYSPTEDINFRGIPVENPKQTTRNSRRLLRYLSSQITSDVKSAFKQTSYETFSYNSESHSLSVENPHNNIHGYVGGWMGLVELSAFDPIFWLHHCFIDNLFWQWQVISNQTDSISYPQLDRQLVPFRNASNAYYTIGEIANVAQFNYSYEEIDREALGRASRDNRRNLFSQLGKPIVSKSEGSKRIFSIKGILFADFGGAFRVVVEANTKSGRISLGTRTVFRFSKECVNCENTPSTGVTFRMKNVHVEDEGEIEFKVQIVVNSRNKVEFREKLRPDVKVVHRVMSSNLELIY